ncbi:MAG TPA: N-acetylmuramoyl-L-alanine amidase [Burkholderiales bacterium]
MAVDVGHYHDKPGVFSASGRAEFEYNLDLARETAQDLRSAGLEVRMIGERGDYRYFNHRTRDAAGAALFVSIHHDSVRERWISDADKFSGFSLFVSRRNPQPEKSLACARAIGAELRGAGFKPSLYHADPVFGEERPFADRENGVHWFDNLAIAHTAQMPAVLVEAGVIVNPAEEARMRDPGVRARVAQAIANGVRACLR